MMASSSHTSPRAAREAGGEAGGLRASPHGSARLQAPQSAAVSAVSADFFTDDSASADPSHHFAQVHHRRQQQHQQGTMVCWWPGFF